MPTPDSGGPARGRRALATLAGIAVAVALLVWSLRGVHPAEVARHIRDAHLAPLLLAVLVATLTFPIRMVRWRLLLRDESGGPLPAAALW
ncbi:MAG TPA: lysylphosphatidylglycerol synthase domain-containing protein, partial [Gemmatimonadales bacterium]|nr:lysylphosphatidylglycerol synthase domain-containing protein [Gemmatimonadales bacterium]